jgi:3-dehydroquinate synthase class II
VTWRMVCSISKARKERFVVDARDWSIIPAENIIAAASGGTEIIFYANGPQHISPLLGALEAGVHGVVLRSDDLDQVSLQLPFPHFHGPNRFLGGNGEK